MLLISIAQDCDDDMNIERYQPGARRSRGVWSGCGCLGALGVGVVGLVLALLLIIPSAPGLLLQVVGFENAGRTDDVFQQAVSNPPPALQNMQAAPASMTVRLGTSGTRTLPATTGGYTVQTGSGQMHIRSDENGLLNLCREFSDICENSGEAVRNASFDLRPGGVVVNGDIYVPQLENWQRVGVVMTFSGQRVRVNGVDVNGQLFTAPQNALAERITAIEQEANRVLSQLQVESGGASYTLQAIYADEQSVTLVLD